MGDKTNNSDMSIDTLYPTVLAWDQEFGLDEFLNGQNDTIFDSETDGSPMSSSRMSAGIIIRKFE